MIDGKEKIVDTSFPDSSECQRKTKVMTMLNLQGSIKIPFMSWYQDPKLHFIKPVPPQRRAEINCLKGKWKKRIISGNYLVLYSTRKKKVLYSDTISNVLDTERLSTGNFLNKAITHFTKSMFLQCCTVSAKWSIWIIHFLTN